MVNINRYTLVLQIIGIQNEPSNAYVNAEAQLQVLSSQLQLLGSGIKVT